MKSLQLHIQFFRAISVLLVFFYHLKLNFFDFGYLGVDIFFVISGYVITSRLYEELEEKNKINFLSFYIRRLKRIFPVLIFILTAVLVFIIFFQPLDLFIGNLSVYICTIFGLSNLYYLFSKKDYFDNVFDDTFGHTWSLGVEEQFYIVFPIFLLFLYKLFSKKNIQILILSIFIISGLLLTFNYSENFQLIFYSPIFRFWEFLLGSIVYISSKTFYKKNTIISTLSFFILIILILSNFYNNYFNALIFTTLLASIFLASYDEKNKFSLIFENNFFVLIGNISYSFYLWHLPIIYFFDLYFVESFLRIPLIFLLTFVLSFLTYNLIENRFRYKKINLNIINKQKILISSFLILIVSYFFYIPFQKSYENSLKKAIKNIIYSVNFLENSLDYTNRVVFYKINLDGNEVYRFCTKESKEFNLDVNNLRIECLKEGKSKNRIFFIEGNSHTANYIPIFNNLKIYPGDSIYYEHSTDILGPSSVNKINDLEKIYKEVVYVTNIENYNLKNLNIIQEKLDKDINVLLLSTIPNISENIKPLKCLIKNIECKYLKKDDFVNRNLNNYFSTIKEFLKHDNEKKIHFFNSYEILCPKDICYVYKVDKDILTHRDNSHLTIEGSLLIENDFFEFYRKYY